MELIKELGFKKLPTRTEFDKAAFGSCKVDGRGHVTLCSWVFEFMEFLQQKPELWMFVPAIQKDGVWVVLEKPEKENYTEEDLSIGEMGCDFIEYQEALDRVLFDGWKLNSLEPFLSVVNHRSYTSIHWMVGGTNINGSQYSTLEQAVNNGIEFKLKQ